mgnify:CR=1 FL=1|tara:strand:- start:358 stop:2091 length:1734 start_codon:yes stop_codon:yes gene_type:complete
MIRSFHLSKLTFFVIFFTFIIFNFSLSEEEPADIWKNLDNQNEQTNTNNQNVETSQSIISEEKNKNTNIIDENELIKKKQTIIGIYDPEINNFNLNMWSQTDGEEIKKTLIRIEKLNLSKLSEDLLFKILFTNAFSPKKNLSSDEFLKIKINWLIKKKRIKDLEIFLKKNEEVGKNSEAIKYLINEYLSSADIKSACDKINFIDRKVDNNYLNKFTIYCLIHNDRKNEAQLIFDLLQESGFKDDFFEDRIKFLLGITDKTNEKVLDNNLLDFYLSYVTSKNFTYQPNDKTDKYIWRYLSSANLIKVNNFEDEDVILTYEKAASQNSFDKDEIFKIYLQMNYSFNQLLNAEEVYKTLPLYKARGLIYQSILLNDNFEKKIDLAFLLKDLFLKDNIYNIYSEELVNILRSIDRDEISEDYLELIDKNLDKKLTDKIKFNNEILHRSKIIKHFLEKDQKISKTEKDFKSVYKKIKRNKKYFISINDIIVLESLLFDGVTLPESLNYDELSLELTVPKNLQELVDQKQLGLVMLKIVEIIGEDNVRDLDADTLYFLVKILNELDLKKIRNNILSEVLPIKI